MLRRMNSGAVLRFALRVAEFTAAEVMTETALTRSTVLGVCDDLVATGWLEELEDSRAAGLTTKGRPARRYRLREDAGIVVGVDAGEHRYAAVAADLRGRPLAERSAELDVPSASAADRLATASSLVEGTVAAAGRRRDEVLLTVVGVPAPVDAHGRSPRGTNDFWATMNPGFPEALAGAVVVENDANLAAVSELAHAHDPADSDVATVLSGERLGAGVILDGRLLRGARGGAGEMRFLDIVEGVGSADGIGALARIWARALVEEHPSSALAAFAPHEIDAERVFVAAAEGDALALDIIARLGARVARVAVVLSSLLDVDKVVIAGAISDAVEPVLVHARAMLAADFPPPVPDVVASTLGRDVVVLGAVEFALGRVRDEPLAFTPAVR